MTRLKVQKLSWFLSWRGLLGQKPHPVMFKTCFGIHTFGMQYPIDIAILDRTSVIRIMKQNLKPNRFFFWNPIFDTVVELPKGTIKKKRLQLNKQINLQTF